MFLLRVDIHNYVVLLQQKTRYWHHTEMKAIIIMQHRSIRPQGQKSFFGISLPAQHNSSLTTFSGALGSEDLLPVKLQCEYLNQMAVIELFSVGFSMLNHSVISLWEEVMKYSLYRLNLTSTRGHPNTRNIHIISGGLWIRMSGAGMIVPGKFQTLWAQCLLYFTTFSRSIDPHISSTCTGYLWCRTVWDPAVVLTILMPGIIPGWGDGDVHRLGIDASKFCEV